MPLLLTALARAFMCQMDGGRVQCGGLRSCPDTVSCFSAQLVGQRVLMVSLTYQHASVLPDGCFYGSWHGPYWLRWSGEQLCGSKLPATAGIEAPQQICLLSRNCDLYSYINLVSTTAQNSIRVSSPPYQPAEPERPVLLGRKQATPWNHTRRHRGQPILNTVAEYPQPENLSRIRVSSPPYQPAEPERPVLLGRKQATPWNHTRRHRGQPILNTVAEYPSRASKVVRKKAMQVQLQVPLRQPARITAVLSTAPHNNPCRAMARGTSLQNQPHLQESGADAPLE
ncbi:unnamed protein product [Symbiodinium sp. CCMP2592]|nr:unnamed protein product [Symbiodinium sp. CCMP2592]